MKKAVVWVVCMVFVALFFSPTVAAQVVLRKIEPNVVVSDTLNPVTNPVDIWIAELPKGAAVIFLYSEDTPDYRVRFEMYDSQLKRLGHDDRLDDMKPHFGTTAGGTYYLVVTALYTTNKTISYKLGCAIVDIERFLVLTRTGDVFSFNITIEGGTTTFLFLLDLDDAFNPDIYVYEQGQKVGWCRNTEDLDYIIWEIGSNKTYRIDIVSASGAGLFWILKMVYRPSL